MSTDSSSYLERALQCMIERAGAITDMNDPTAQAWLDEVTSYGSTAFLVAHALAADPTNVDERAGEQMCAVASAEADTMAVLPLRHLISGIIGTFVLGVQAERERIADAEIQRGRQ